MNIRETVKLRKEKRQKDGGIEFDTCIVSTKELDELLNLIDKQNKVIDETARTIIKERGYKNIDEHPEWIDNTKRFFFKKVENDERRTKFLRKEEEDVQ